MSRYDGDNDDLLPWCDDDTVPSGGSGRVVSRPPGGSPARRAAPPFADAGVPERRRRPGLVVGMVLAAVLLVAAGALAGSLFAVRGRNAATPPAATSAPVPAASSPPATGTVQPSGSPSAAASAVASVDAGPPRCHTSDLRIVWGPGNGAAGTVYSALGFTNTSGHTCRMYGFPGMEPVDGSGNQIPVRVVRTADRPTLITLAAGQTGWAVVHWSQVPGTYTGAACTGPVPGLVVTPPDETTYQRLDRDLHICGDGTMVTGPVTDHLPTGA